MRLDLLNDGKESWGNVAHAGRETITWLVVLDLLETRESCKQKIEISEVTLKGPSQQIQSPCGYLENTYCCAIYTEILETRKGCA